MAMVLQGNRVASSDSSRFPMDSCQQPQQSTNQQIESFRQKIHEKVEEGKRDRDTKRCQSVLDDIMTLLRLYVADVENYNSTFGETRPTFYMQEFQRLTDHIDVLTKARDTLSEYLREIENGNNGSAFPYSSSLNDVLSMNNQFQQQLQYSPVLSRSIRSSPPVQPSNHMSSTSSIHSGARDNFHNSHHVNTNDFNPLPIGNDHRGRSPTGGSNNFIRVHFPNKHTTALAPKSDETLEAALKLPASRHSITNLRAYTPIYRNSRQPCSWDTILDRVRETEIELQENKTLDHLFEDIRTPRFPMFTATRCVLCQRHVREAHKRCVSCGNSYHNGCYQKAPICSHPILQHIKHTDADRFNDNERTSSQTRSKAQSHSLPRIPLSRRPINTNQIVDSLKDFTQDTHGYLSTSTTNSYIQPVSSSLPSSASPIHHLPQLLLSPNGTAIATPERTRPNLPKAKADHVNDTKKSTTKYASDWEIPSEDVLHHGRMVGKGTYGTVYKAELRLHGQVALKELNFTSPTPSQSQAFRNEVMALKKITHQNTLNFYGYILSPRFAIVTQWCEGSTLYKHIHVLERHWKIHQLVYIARQICQGMSYLHDRQIIHRDLKSSNVFLDMCAEPDDVGVSWRVKIGDFGLAAVKTVLAEGVNKQFQPTGSVLWMASEVIQQKDPNCYSSKSDVYAYGCVLFEMFSGKLPHAPNNNKEQIMWLVGKGKLKIKVEQCHDDTPDSICDLIRQCTEFQREQRPNFAPEIDDILSKFDLILPRLQRSQSDPGLIRNPQDDLLGLSINFGVPKNLAPLHRGFNPEAS